MPLDVTEELARALRTGEPWDAGAVPIHASLIRTLLEDAEDPSPHGLTLIGGEVHGDLDLTRLEVPFPLRFEGVTFRRRVRLEAMRAKDIWIAGGRMNVEGAPGAVIDASGLQCRSLAFGSLELNWNPEDVVAAAITLWGVEILGDLHFEGVDIVAEEPGRWSVWLRESVIAGDVGVTVCEFPAEVDFSGSTIGKRLYLDGTATAPAMRTAHLRLDRTTIGELNPNLIDVGGGTVGATGARIEHLQVWDPAGRPKGSSFTGTWPTLATSSLEIGRLSVPESQVGELVSWISSARSNGSVDRQPALAVAQALADDGLNGPATSLRIEAEDQFRRDRIDRWKSRVPAWTPVGRALRHLWRTVSKVTAGHGYATGRALVGVVLCVIGIYVATLVGEQIGGFEYIGEATNAQPALFPEIFTIDTVLTPMELGQTDSWIATSRSLTVVLTALKGGAIFFSAMALGSLSGLFQRR